MKLLMTADAVGGVWTYACELSAGLSAAGAEVHLAAMGPAPSEDQKRRATAAGVAGLYLHSAPLEWMPDPWDGVDAAEQWLIELASDLDPDVIHLNSFAHGSAWAGAVPVVCVGHSCVLSWWRAVKSESPPATWDAYRRRVRQGLAGADEVVAPTRWMLHELRDLYGIRGGRVIHNGLDLPDEPAAQREPIAITAGRLWDEGKNLDLALEIAPRLRWPLVVAGTDLEVGDNVRVLGELDREGLLRRLTTAGLFVLPARYEPFGLGPLEAALAGCPLVLGDIPTLRELWDGAAEFVAPDDPEALLAICNSLIADDAERRRVAARARDRALRYTRAAMTNAYVSLYDDVSSRQPTVGGRRS